MRAKFRDTKDLLDYADECRVASEKALRAYTEADQSWRAATELMGRLVLPDDMREAEPKGEWIIELTRSDCIGGFASGTNLISDKPMATRFNSEAEAADFAADHWKGFRPKVVPHHAPAETK